MCDTRETVKGVDTWLPSVGPDERHVSDTQAGIVTYHRHIHCDYIVVGAMTSGMA